jgi:exopolysaccharide biosynthesis WecB/TagA/CpsF family protein
VTETARAQGCRLQESDHPGIAIHQPRFALPDEGTVSVNLDSLDATLAVIEAHLRAGTGFCMATLNLDHLVKLGKSPPFRDAYRQTTYVTADGNPVVWLSRLQGKPVELVPGSDLVDPICRLAARHEAPVAFFGTSKATLDRAAAILTTRHAGLRVVYRVAPEADFDPAAALADSHAADIARSGAALCLVALGAPKQEIFALRAARHARHCGFISIGAGLDFVAGTQTRAPQWILRLALEWAWRMLRDPGRLAGRYAACAAIMPSLTAAALRLRREGRRAESRANECDTIR